MPPSVVLILTDDQRWDTLDATHGLGGGVVMPTVKGELVDSGVTFSRAFVTTSVCVPSRCSLLTGRYAHNHGVLKNEPPNGGAGDFDDSVTLATLLQDAGYRTALIGKYMNGYDALSPYIPPGWDDWQVFAKDPTYFNYDLNENGTIVHHAAAPADYSTDVLLAKSLSFIASSVAQATPFLLVFAPNAPHHPFTPAPRHAGSYAAVPRWTPPNLNENDVSDKPGWLQAIPKLSGATLLQIHAQRIKYLESLQAVDEAVGSIMQALRDAGIDDETLVIYASDNSLMWGEHRLKAKEAPYEESMRVPFVVRYPPLAAAPRTDQSLVLNVDVLPTVLELAGVTIPAGVNGESMVPLLPGNPPTWRTDLLNEHWLGANQPIPDNAQVRTEQYKYVEYADVNQGTELYDLVGDPNELVNRTNDPALATVKADLSARLQVLKAAMVPPGRTRPHRAPLAPHTRSPPRRT